MTRVVVQATWTDAPHLSEEAKAGLINAYPPHEREARTKGIPQIGSGAIYPIPESEITCDPIELPPHFRYFYAMDVGWRRSAALWFAHDTQNDVLYIYGEYYTGNAEPAIHAAAIRGRGDWIPGVIDPNANGRGQRDGEALLTSYRNLDLNLTTANNAVETGLWQCWTRLSAGKIKVFKTLQNFLMEYRIYRRDEHGKVVKSNDHLMDCFAGETLVVTPDGQRRIKDLAETGLVLTRDGAWARYTNAGLVKRGARTVRVRFEDGREVRCTPDHLFLTDEGWVRADCMAELKCYDAVTQRVQAHSWFRSLSRRKFNASAMRTTISWDCTFAQPDGQKAAFCIERSGLSTTTGEACQRDITSTTSIMTDRTTIPPTCRRSSGPTTSVTTSSDTSARRPRRPASPHLSGTEARPGSSGTSSTSRTFETSFTRAAASLASNAALRLKARLTAAIGSVRTNAKRNGAGTLALTTRNVAARTVARISWLIATSKHASVRDFALVSCIAVEDAGRADVYCLTVPGTHAFAVEGGLVVHNCLRYGVMSGIDLAVFKPREDWNISRRTQHVSDFDAYAKMSNTGGKHRVEYDAFSGVG